MSTLDPFYAPFVTSPAENFFLFRQHLFSAYREVLTDHDTRGGLFMVVDDATWSELPGSTTNAGNIRPRPDILNDTQTSLLVPPIIPVGTSAEARRVEKALREAAIRDNLVIQALHHRLVKSIPASLVTSLSHPVHGMADVSPRTIFERCLADYGVLSNDALERADAAVRVPMNAESENLEAVIDRQAAAHAVFVAAGEPLSEHFKAAHLENAIKHVEYLRLTIQSYWSANPGKASRSFSGLVSHLHVHGPSFRSMTVRTSYAAAVNTTSVVVPGSTPEQMRIAELERLLAASATALAATSQPRRKNSGTKAALYCWKHGYGTHSGAACKHMANSSDFTAAHKAATSPVVIGDQKGSTRGHES